ncbi:MAG: PaaX family transcriptional regulator C-terminal domain-containing protein [Tetrasphaera sp.]
MDALAADELSPSPASARALLTTILGEFVHAGTGQAWTGSLVEALAALGVEEKAARQALARIAADGLLRSTRHGRRVRWELTDAGAALLTEGQERIYTFLRTHRRWDRKWVVLSVGVPETQRRLRHRLRTRLSWMGMGSPSPGLWVIPDASREAEVLATVDELGLTERAFTWTGPYAGATPESELIASAWDLDSVATLYLGFLDTFGDLEVHSDAEAFVAQVRLIHEWRAFPFLDAALPAELLRRDWPGITAAALFHRRRDQWHRSAQREWRRMEAVWDARI